MPLLLKIDNRRRWDRPAWLMPGEAPADAVQTLRVTENELSVWYVDPDLGNLNRVLSALAANKDHIEKIDYAIVDDGVPARCNIEVRHTVGTCPDEHACREWHRDLIELSGRKLVSLTESIIATGAERKALVAVRDMLCRRQPRANGHIKRGNDEGESSHGTALAGVIFRSTGCGGQVEEHPPGSHWLFPKIRSDVRRCAADVGDPVSPSIGATTNLSVNGSSMSSRRQMGRRYKESWRGCAAHSRYGRWIPDTPDIARAPAPRGRYIVVATSMGTSSFSRRSHMRRPAGCVIPRALARASSTLCARTITSTVARCTRSRWRRVSAHGIR